MGLKCSPYTAVKFMLWAIEVILGDPDDQANVFRWSQVELNLPGSKNYDSSKSWVCKVRANGVLAADLFVYVDDLRPTGPTWKAAQRVSSVLAFLGLQDAARKRRPSSLEPGAWAGSVVYTSDGRVVVLVSKEKWEKTQAIVKRLNEWAASGEPVNRKQLESDRGFLIYVARTYPAMKPYLKGIHATIDSWRGNLDDEGWKLPKKVTGKRKRDTEEQRRATKQRVKVGR
jgi:hypothetical protein